MPVISMLKSTARNLAAASALSLMMAGSAFAFDGNAVAERLKELYAAQGGELAYQSVETNGSTVVLKGASVRAPGTAAQEKSIDLGDVALNNVSDASDGGYDIGQADIPDMTLSFEGTNIAIKGMEMENLHLAPKGSSDPLASILYYQKAEINEITVNQAGNNIATMQDIVATISPFKQGSPIDYTWDVDKIAIDLSKAEPSKAKETLTALGYEKINGHIDSKGSWSVPDGRFKLDQFNLVMDDGGTLGMTFDLGGYTLDFIKGIQEAQATLSDNPDSDAAGLAMLGLMQQLTVNGASIRFDDASLTNKLLDYFANQQGSDRATLTNQVKAVLPLFAGQLKNAAFAAQVTQAVSTYIDNPKSLEIRATPSAPVPVAVLMATGSAQPEKLPDLLNVTVTANK
ncbi:hypothetical protein ATN84_10265 [Paramesorhizobium deserti]|uniref:DUF945 domain-containing protein n=1 Tax=Paramesorhizobium deserti TaxID=1494590 RepID=A0A135HWZ8_9HYPH|nr:hypothetical protein [Paramesorhizobium deserti]KXF77710.1 hypothetical protein ATN84_10265 [Paramesorhizobium deserti]